LRRSVNSDSLSVAVPIVAVAALFILFFIAPVGAVFDRAIRASADVGWWEQFFEIARSARAVSVTRFTIGQASVSAAVAVLIAIPGAYLVSHFTFPGRRVIYSLSLLPFVLPSIIVVVAMIGFYGKNGLINRLLGTDFNLVYNFRGIVLAHVYYNFSLAIRIIATAWSGIDTRYREAASSLGDSDLGIFFRVTLPLLAPAIVTAFTLVFIYSFLSFGVVLVFGGIKYATFEVAIYREMFINLDLPATAAFSLLQLLFSGAFIAVTTRSIFRNRAGTVEVGGALPPLSSLPTTRRIVLGVYILGIILFVVGPIGTMVVRAFTESTGAIGLENFTELLVPGAADRNIESVLRSTVPLVILRSIGIAVTSGTVTFVVAVGIALWLRGRRHSIVESVLQIPLGVSLVTVGVGLRLLWQGVVPPIVLVVLGQFFVAFPLVYRIVRSGVEELSQRMVQSAEILGARRLQILRDIEIPLLKRTFLNAFAYAVALPFADLTIVMAVGRGRLTTFPVAIYRLIGFRSFDLALALSVLYVAVCLILFWVIDATSLSATRKES
jgi:thiamine transport system permease protein